MRGRFELNDYYDKYVKNINEKRNLLNYVKSPKFDEEYVSKIPFLKNRLKDADVDYIVKTVGSLLEKKNCARKITVANENLFEEELHQLVFENPDDLFTLVFPKEYIFEMDSSFPKILLHQKENYLFSQVQQNELFKENSLDENDEEFHKVKPIPYPPSDFSSKITSFEFVNDMIKDFKIEELVFCDEKKSDGEKISRENVISESVKYQKKHVIVQEVDVICTGDRIKEIKDQVYPTCKFLSKESVDYRKKKNSKKIQNEKRQDLMVENRSFTFNDSLQLNKNEKKVVEEHPRFTKVKQDIHTNNNDITHFSKRRIDEIQSLVKDPSSTYCDSSIKEFPSPKFDEEEEDKKEIDEVLYKKNEKIIIRICKKVDNSILGMQLRWIDSYRFKNDISLNEMKTMRSEDEKRQYNEEIFEVVDALQINVGQIVEEKYVGKGKLPEMPENEGVFKDDIIALEMKEKTKKGYNDVKNDVIEEENEVKMVYTTPKKQTSLKRIIVIDDDDDDEIEIESEKKEEIKIVEKERKNKDVKDIRKYIIPEYLQNIEFSENDKEFLKEIENNAKLPPFEEYKDGCLGLVHNFVSKLESLPTFDEFVENIDDKVVKSRFSERYSPFHYNFVNQGIGNKNVLCVLPPSVSFLPIVTILSERKIQKNKKKKVLCVCKDMEDMQKVYDYVSSVLGEESLLITEEMISQDLDLFSSSKSLICVQCDLLIANVDHFDFPISLLVYYDKNMVFGGVFHQIYEQLMFKTKNNKIQIVIMSSLPTKNVSELVEYFIYIECVVVRSRSDLITPNTPIFKPIYYVNLQNSPLMNLLKEIETAGGEFRISSVYYESFEDLKLKAIQDEMNAYSSLSESFLKENKEKYIKALNLSVLSSIYDLTKMGSFHNVENFITTTMKDPVYRKFLSMSVLKLFERVKDCFKKEGVHPIVKKVGSLLNEIITTQKRGIKILVLVENSYTSLEIERIDKSCFAVVQCVSNDRQKKVDYLLTSLGKFYKCENVLKIKNLSQVVVSEVSKLAFVKFDYSDFQFVITLNDLKLPKEINELYLRNQVISINIRSTVIEMLDFDDLCDNWITKLRGLISPLVEVNTNVFKKNHVENFSNVQLINENELKKLKLISMFEEEKKKKRFCSIFGSLSSLQNFGLIADMRNRYNINVIERDITLPINFVISVSECIGIVRMDEILQNSTNKITDIIGEWLENLTYVSISFGLCHLIFEVFTKDYYSHISLLHEYVSRFVAVASTLEIKTMIKYSFSTNDTSDIIHSLCENATIQNRFFNISSNELSEEETPEELFLASFPSINNFVAQLMLSKFSIKGLMTMEYEILLENFGNLIPGKFLSHFHNLVRAKADLEIENEESSKSYESIQDEKRRKLIESSDISYSNREIEENRFRKLSKSNDGNRIVSAYQGFQNPNFNNVMPTNPFTISPVNEQTYIPVQQMLYPTFHQQPQVIGSPVYSSPVYSSPISHGMYPVNYGSPSQLMLTSPNKMSTRSMPNYQQFQMQPAIYSNQKVRTPKTGYVQSLLRGITSSNPQVIQQQRLQTNPSSKVSPNFQTLIGRSKGKDKDGLQIPQNDRIITPIKSLEKFMYKRKPRSKRKKK